jgi:hypothetical protein
MVTLTGLVSLGVDVAHVRAVRVQLQGAADAGARAGARNIGSGLVAIQNAVVAAAHANNADGAAVVVDPNNDIDFGTWSNGTFTVLSGAGRSSANAIRVRCSHTAAKGNAVPTMFGSLLGVTSSNVSTQSTAAARQTGAAGFIGYAGVTMKNNAFFGGYSSSVIKTPTQNSADSNMSVGTNSFILTKNNDEIDGDVILGPGASVAGVTVIGTTQSQSSAIPTPTMPAWNPIANPGAIPQAYSIFTNTTLPGGTYYFTSMDLEADLNFSGPAVVFVNGPITVGGTLTAFSMLPADLTIYQYGITTFGDGASNGMSIYARVIAPGSDFVTKNNLDFYGSGIFSTITAKNNAEFYYDEQQGLANGQNSVTTVN